MFEPWPYSLLKAGTRAQDLINYLRELGFILWRMDKGLFRELKDEHLPDPVKEFSYYNVLCSRNPLLFHERYAARRAVDRVHRQDPAVPSLEAT